MTPPHHSIIHKFLGSIQLSKPSNPPQDYPPPLTSRLRFSSRSALKPASSQTKRRHSVSISLVIPPSLLDLNALPGSAPSCPLIAQTPSHDPFYQSVQEPHQPNHRHNDPKEPLSTSLYDHIPTVTADKATIHPPPNNDSIPTLPSIELPSLDIQPQPLHILKPRLALPHKPRPQAQKRKKSLPLYKQVILNRFRMTAHGLEIIHRGPQRGIRYLLEQESKALRQAIKLRNAEREERRRSLILRNPTMLPFNVGESETTKDNGRRLRRIGRPQSWAHFPKNGQDTDHKIPPESTIGTAYRMEFWGWDR